jgi:hypothetical protein
LLVKNSKDDVLRVGEVGGGAVGGKLKNLKYFVLTSSMMKWFAV